MRALLIVDDQPSVLQTLDYVFSLHGCRALLATSGAAALEIAEKDGFDAALIDLHMPGMDGLTLCRVLRERRIAAGSDIPVWIMSAAATAIAAKKSAEAGAVALLKKPFEVEEFLADVERYCVGDQPIPPLTSASSASDTLSTPGDHGPKPAHAQ